MDKMDTFIRRSVALTSARPDSTRVSIRYTHKKVLHSKESTVGGCLPAVVVVKTYDPKSGTCYRIRLTRINELSRVLSSLGARPVEVSAQEGGVEHKRGLSSIMAEQDYEAPAAPQKKRRAK